MAHKKSKYDYYWKGEPIENLTKDELIKAIKYLDSFIHAQRKSHREIVKLLSD